MIRGKTRSSSPDIIPISPPPNIHGPSSRTSSSVGRPSRRLITPEASSSSSAAAGAVIDLSDGTRPSPRRSPRQHSSVSIPRPREFSPTPELKAKMAKHVQAYEDKVEVQGGKRKAREHDVRSERNRMGKLSRSAVTERMINTLGKDTNPITNSDLYSRTDHFVSASTGHQQSNRGGGGGGAATYWEVRMAKTADQARGKESDLFKGCVFYINGSTGPRVSNLQAQHMITQNGGRFSPLQSSSCTHIIASGGLSGTKTQKWINGQAGRGTSKRTKVIRIDWVLDCVEKGVRLPETSYSVISDPSQHNLFASFGVKPKDISAIPSKKA